MLLITAVRLNCFVVFCSLFIPAWDFGLLRYYLNAYVPPSDKCRVDNPPESKIKVISISDFYAPFFILILGLCVSGVIFVLENIFRFLFDKINNRKNAIVLL